MSGGFFKILILAAVLVNLSQGQTSTRYLDELFREIDVQKDIVYGKAVSVSGDETDLLLDIYQPAVDTFKRRPLIIFVHGGGFQNGDKSAGLSRRICNSMARKGYVTASINYRMSKPEILTDSLKYFEALYRGIQDAKASIRFFRKENKRFNIDPDHIYIMGTSAGAKISLHAAYLDQCEVPNFIDTSKIGTVEGESGNPGFPSAPDGVINCWGALWDWKWLQKGDVPVFSVHGTNDKMVPPDSSFSYNGFKYGSIIVSQRAKELNVPSGLRIFEHAGHTLDNNTLKQDSCVTDIAKWLLNLNDDHNDMSNASKAVE